MHSRARTVVASSLPRTGAIALKAPAVFLLAMFAMASVAAAHAQENYFITSSHQMEEPGHLEIGFNTLSAAPRDSSAFFAGATEFEYGVKTWWTTELYLDSQTTRGESSVFTGFRWENRVKPLRREHIVNPVLYMEFEDINAADKSMLEVVGNDTRVDFRQRNDRHEKKREAELKLILSSNLRDWNFSENLIAERNLSSGPLEFGYALGASRPISTHVSSQPCRFCRENFDLGAEMYGGLGTARSFGLRETSHYLAPVVGWRMPEGPEWKVSPSFGLNDASNRFMLRLSVAYEIDDVWSKLRGR